ncbi:uncharacterized protein LOC128350769 [Hemicordylus capensis]|uniref:uncharacterized protein LOC128350769 n=1 Tax=Hemicordylus capensis TaxID=884348 RepID=UPI0023023178|nr:uncharacterized protein LOC128350769 [Hemicordylus capensis]
MRTMTEEMAEDWDEFLPFIVLSHNGKKHCSTKFSPFRLFLRREAKLACDVPLELDCEVHWKDEDIAKEVVHQAVKFKATVEAAQENIQKAQERQQKQYRARKTSKKGVMNVSVGDKVLLLNHRKRTHKGAKFEQDYLGPYTVDKLEGKKVTLRTPQGNPIKNTYNISSVKPYKEICAPVPEDHNYIAVSSQNVKCSAAPMAPKEDLGTPMSQKECNSLWQSAAAPADAAMEIWAKKAKVIMERKEEDRLEAVVHSTKL